MKIQIKKENAFLFYVAWIMMEIHICIANSNAAAYSISIISYIAILIFLSKILLTMKYSIRELCLMGILLIGGGISAISSKDMRVLWFAIVFSASKNIDFDKLVRYSFRVMIICCMTFVIMYLCGLIEGSHSITDKGIRLSFGLGHANMCAAYYSLIIMFILYIYYNKIKIYHIILFVIGEYGVYLATKSNTGLIVVSITLLMFIVVKYFPMQKFNIKVIASAIIIIIAFFTILPIIYDKNISILKLLDKLMTGRLRQANYYYLNYGIRLFGNDIRADLLKVNTDNILDMGYAKMLINNGLFFYIIVVGGYLLLIKRAIKEQRKDIIVFFGAMLIYLLSENVATYIFMNVTMMSFSEILFKANKLKQTERKFNCFYFK